MKIMKDGKFSVTLENQNIISDYIRSFYLNIFVGTPISWALASLLIYRIQLDNATKSGLWIVLILLIIISSIITIIAPISAIRRYGKLAAELFIQLDQVHVSLKNGSQLQLSMSEMERLRLEFKIGRTTYNAIYLRSSKNNLSFFLIPDLFESKEAIEMWFEKVGG